MKYCNLFLLNIKKIFCNTLPLIFVQIVDGMLIYIIFQQPEAHGRKTKSFKIPGAR
jgi:hypothetical protein